MGGFGVVVKKFLSINCGILQPPPPKKKEKMRDPCTTLIKKRGNSLSLLITTVLP